MTFTGLWKPLLFPTIYKDLSAFVIGKIRYLVLDSLPGGEAWARERHHRGALLQLGLKSPGVRPGEGDILLISDADEIPKPMFLYALKHCSGAVYPHSMQAALHYYSFNRCVEWSWHHNILRKLSNIAFCLTGGLRRERREARGYSQKQCCTLLLVLVTLKP